MPLWGVCSRLIKGDLPLPTLTTLPPPPPPFAPLKGTFQGEAFCSWAMMGSFSTSSGERKEAVLWLTVLR